jgi:hypothetical protein
MRRMDARRPVIVTTWERIKSPLIIETSVRLETEA